MIEKRLFSKCYISKVETMIYLDNLFRILHLEDVKIEWKKAYKSIASNASWPFT